MTKRTLQERIQARWLNRGEEKLFVHVHVRAELQRLARQVRRLGLSKVTGRLLRDAHIKTSDVLALLKEAQR